MKIRENRSGYEALTFQRHRKHWIQERRLTKRNAQHRKLKR